VEDISFYNNCPTLSQQSKDIMEADITEAELLDALKTCKDSAPGSDGLTYDVYRKMWDIVGKFIAEAWRYTCEMSIMPPSHLESIIILLPKEGKDTSDIGHWRPITLSNCDAKIITKALTCRMTKVANDIIDNNQTAYVRGRSIMDGLRGINFLKNHCESNGINSALISLDARKAFDSVDHEYIEKTLKRYGFGPNLIKYIKVLYKGLIAKIMINGKVSKIIKILRGIKQGDALSGIIFNICIDPLIRNILANRHIEIIEINTRITNLKLNSKTGAFADDIWTLCKNNNESIQGVFTEYERLTNKSGLTLNANKFEILTIHDSGNVIGRERLYVHE
jgi:hypothetical protein